MKEVRFKSIYYAEGLGIDAAIWSGVKGKLMEYPLITAPSSMLLSRKLQTLVHALHSFLQTREFYLFPDKDAHFVFLSSVSRLRLDREPEKLWFCPLKELVRNPIHLSLEGLIDAFLSRLEKQIGYRVTVATTIHGYATYMSRLGRKLRIFVDGYHPSNYPRSYLDGYASDDFVVRTMLDARWFRKYGRHPIKPYGFLLHDLFNEVEGTIGIGTVVLLLNHAGDWTSLINRSDTDLLINQFVDAASFFPDKRFVIRPHPTMTHPQHEGHNSIKRIRSFVAWTGLENLDVSSISLDEDFQRGDLFVSEYSQTLIDVYRIGKPGLIANCTGRRSFMVDFEELGFPVKLPGEILKDALRRIFNEPARHITAQNKAVTRYNEALVNFTGEKGDDE